MSESRTQHSWSSESENRGCEEEYKAAGPILLEGTLSSEKPRAALAFFLFLFKICLKLSISFLFYIVNFHDKSHFVYIFHADKFNVP